MLLWLVTGSAVLLALLALGHARRLGRRLDELNHAYWELRYEHTRLRARVARLDPEDTAPAEPEPAPSMTPVAYVPLASLKAPASRTGEAPPPPAAGTPRQA